MVRYFTVEGNADLVSGGTPAATARAAQTAALGFLRDVTGGP